MQGGYVSRLWDCVCQEYYNHKKGCPNYGRHKYCPPNLPMFDQVFDLSKPVYAIYNKFDFKRHVERMQQRHPEWSDRQLANCLYWQGGARKKLKGHVVEFNNLFSGKGYVVTRSPEAMGVNMTRTMKGAGIELEWPPRRVTYQIAMAGVLLQSRGDFLEHALCWT